MRSTGRLGASRSRHRISTALALATAAALTLGWAVPASGAAEPDASVSEAAAPEPEATTAPADAGSDLAQPVPEAEAPITTTPDIDGPAEEPVDPEVPTATAPAVDPVVDPESPTTTVPPADPVDPTTTTPAVEDPVEPVDPAAPTTTLPQAEPTTVPDADPVAEPPHESQTDADDAADSADDTDDDTDADEDLAALSAVPPPAVTVTPNTGLVDLQQVVVEGTGFTGYWEMLVAQCPAGAEAETCVGGAHEWAYDGQDGTFSLDARVRRIIASTSTGSIDCASAPGACEIVVSSYLYYYDEGLGSAGGTFDPIRIPLTFDPSGPVPVPPAITVTPHTDLVHGQTVTVEGTGFVPGSWIDLSECSLSGENCRYLDSYGETDAAGSFSATVVAKRRLRGWESDPVDCAFEACEMVADSYGGGVYESATAPVSFDPSVPLPPPPTLALDPPTDLVDHQVATLTGAGWTPGDGVYIQECVEIAGVQVYCGSPYRYTSAGADGTFEQSIGLRRFITYYEWGEGNKRFDCASVPGACRIEARNFDEDLETAQLALVFDPDAPPAPPPTLDVEPSTDLRDRQKVRVHGEGFLPGESFSVEQCVDDVYLYQCRGYEYVTPDDDGSFDVELTVRRMIGSMSAEAVDCVTERCVMVSRNYYDPDSDIAIPLDFDPGVPFAMPQVTVTPNVGLEAGQTVAVHGSGFSPNASIAMAQCEGETLSAIGCDLGTVVYTNSDDDGAFTQDFVVKSVLGYDATGRDCTEPGACIVGAANMSDFAEAGRDWLTFGDPPAVSVGAAEMVEGHDGTTVAEVPVTMSEPSGAPVTVSYEVAAGTAANTGDFVAERGVLMIEAGSSDAVIEVAVAGDTAVEGDETVVVVLSDPVHASLDDATGLLTIIDDDKELDDIVVIVVDDTEDDDPGVQSVAAGSATPSAMSRSGGTLPYTGGGSQAPLGAWLVVVGAVILAIAGARRRDPGGAR